MTDPCGGNVPQEWAGDVTFATDFVSGEFQIGALTVGDRIERDCTMTACPCGGDRIGGSGCTCDPPFGVPS